MKVLSIGNSFSVDATRYLHQVAHNQGVELNVAVLYVPGCTLSQHYRFMLRESNDYVLYYNGHNTGFHVTLKEALLSQQWDVITMQQGSIHSADPENLHPFAAEIAAFVKKCAPKAKLVVHQTWAYEEGSQHLMKAGFETQKQMFASIESAYNVMVDIVKAVGLIPSGKLMQQLLENGIKSFHRDTLHVTYGLGRFALALLWYRMFTGNSVESVTYSDFDEPVSPDEIALAKKLVDAIKPIF